MWRDPNWMPVNPVWLAVMNLKHRAQFNAVDVRNGVLGIRIEPHTWHTERRRQNNSVAANG